MKFGKFELPVGERVLVMGIVNVTPDSFSDAGKFASTEKAVEHALRMAEDGADIIDVGGESTRPGSEPVSVDQEISRVVPVIREISRKAGVPISIDSCKPEVVEKALQAGASMINDVNGLRGEGMAELAARYDVPVCIMHMQGTPKEMQKNPSYDDVVKDVKSFLKKQADYAVKKGVSRNKIIVDPGIGFGKTTEHNIELIRKIREFKKLGYPVLIGPSRKAFIGNILNAPVGERLAGTIAASVVCAVNGADVIRVHDVKEVVQALRLAETIIR
ncbi:MAG: dihydropteroate synthase [Candidatus Altiarchaeota archaeon]|nr:dihydropteroate synthase [Candidatus Altiarchaeota archaeon]